MNLYQQRHNIYRQRALGYYYASNGIKVVPNLRMGSTDTIPDALRGIEYGSTVAVSTVGAVGDVECTAKHVQLLTEAVDKLGVTDVLVYAACCQGLPTYHATIMCTLFSTTNSWRDENEQRERL